MRRWVRETGVQFEQRFEVNRLTKPGFRLGNDGFCVGMCVEPVTNCIPKNILKEGYPVMRRWVRETGVRFEQRFEVSRFMKPGFGRGETIDCA